MVLYITREVAHLKSSSWNLSDPWSVQTLIAFKKPAVAENELAIHERLLVVFLTTILHWH